jgi:Zn finger protein HypA/HybF involved in hydrogenase expression
MNGFDGTPIDTMFSAPTTWDVADPPEEALRHYYARQRAAAAKRDRERQMKARKVAAEREKKRREAEQQRTAAAKRKSQTRTARFEGDFSGGTTVDEFAGATMTVKGVGKVKEPTHMKALAAKYGVSPKVALEKWGEAQKAANKQYPDLKSKLDKSPKAKSRYYAIVTAIFKNMLKGAGEGSSEQAGESTVHVAEFECATCTEWFEATLLPTTVSVLCPECHSPNVHPNGEIREAQLEPPVEEDEQALVDTIRKLHESGRDVKAYVPGLPELTIEAAINGDVLPSRNYEFGFMGEADSPTLWSIASKDIVSLTGCRPEEARRFLDSQHGRHLAEKVTAETNEENGGPAALEGILTRDWFVQTWEKGQVQTTTLDDGTDTMDTLPEAEELYALVNAKGEPYEEKGKAKQAMMTSKEAESKNAHDRHITTLGLQWRKVEEAQVDEAPWKSPQEELKLARTYKKKGFKFVFKHGRNPPTYEKTRDTSGYPTAPKAVLTVDDYIEELQAKLKKKAESLDEAKLECMECGAKFSRNVKAGSTPKCPKCGSTDVELAESVDEQEWLQVRMPTAPRSAGDRIEQIIMRAGGKVGDMEFGRSTDDEPGWNIEVTTDSPAVTKKIEKALKRYKPKIEKETPPAMEPWDSDALQAEIEEALGEAASDNEMKAGIAGVLRAFERAQWWTMSGPQAEAFAKKHAKRANKNLSDEDATKIARAAMQALIKLKSVMQDSVEEALIDRIKQAAKEAGLSTKQGVAIWKASERYSSVLTGEADLNKVMKATKLPMPKIEGFRSALQKANRASLAKYEDLDEAGKYDYVFVRVMWKSEGTLSGKFDKHVKQSMKDVEHYTNSEGIEAPRSYMVIYRTKSEEAAKEVEKEAKRYRATTRRMTPAEVKAEDAKYEDVDEAKMECVKCGYKGPRKKFKGDLGTCPKCGSSYTKDVKEDESVDEAISAIEKKVALKMQARGMKFALILPAEKGEPLYVTSMKIAKAVKREDYPDARIVPIGKLTGQAEESLDEYADMNVQPHTWLVTLKPDGPDDAADIKDALTDRKNAHVGVSKVTDMSGGRISFLYTGTHSNTGSAKAGVKAALKRMGVDEEVVVEVLDEDTRLGKPDKRVLNAFSEKEAADSKKLTTDGKQLDGNWIGGRKIAWWEGDKVYVRTSSRTEVTIVRALKKVVPAIARGGFWETEDAPADLDEGFKKGQKITWTAPDGTKLTGVVVSPVIRGKMKVMPDKPNATEVGKRVRKEVLVDPASVQEAENPGRFAPVELLAPSRTEDGKGWVIQVNAYNPARATAIAKKLKGKVFGSDRVSIEVPQKNRKMAVAVVRKMLNKMGIDIEETDSPFA